MIYPKLQYLQGNLELSSKNLFHLLEDTVKLSTIFFYGKIINDVMSQ